MSAAVTRKSLRRDMRRARRALDARERERLAAAMARRFVGEGICQRAERVAAYLTNDAEMDPQPLIERLWAVGKRVYLPIMRRPRMWFVPYTADSELVANRFGIPEPNVSPDARIPLAALDLVLMPLVAFDDAGNRLGMGGGYYDRTFAFLQRRAQPRNPRLLGIAYELQRLPALPVEPWDMPLSGIVTERGLQHFARRGA